MYITIWFGVNVCVGLSPSLSSKTKKLLVYLDDRPLNEAVIRELLFVLSFSQCINIWGDSNGAVNSYRREDWNGKRYTVNDCIELTIGSECKYAMRSFVYLWFGSRLLCQWSHWGNKLPIKGLCVLNHRLLVPEQCQLLKSGAEHPWDVRSGGNNAYYNKSQLMLLSASTEGVLFARSWRRPSFLCFKNHTVWVDVSYDLPL